MLKLCIDFLNETISQYGSKGDKTLEYIGLRLQNSRFVDWKIYHKFDNACPEAFADFHSNIHYKMYQEISANIPIRMCDYSHSVMLNAQHQRSLCQFSMNTDYDTVIRAVSDLSCIPNAELQNLITAIKTIHRILPAPFSPLIQLGSETDYNGELIEIKYYLNLKTDYSKHPVLNDTLLDALETLHGIPKEKYQQLYEMFDILRTNNYYPTFIGVNASRNQTEYKLYFISALFGRRLKAEYQMQNEAVINQLSEDELKGEFLQSANENHLWLEGIAVSFSNPEILRLYWKELYETLGG